MKAVPPTSPLQSEQTIVFKNVWTSTSPNSEFIVEVKVKIPAGGFTNTLENVIHWVLPLVTLLLSAGDWTVILTPGIEFETVKVPRTNPVPRSIDCIIAWVEEGREFTINVVLNVFTPPPAVITAEPTVSPIFIKEIAKEPPSETNDEVNISGSLASWLTLIVKSVKLSQSVLESETETVGEKGIQETLPVLPPTQLPQLSVKAVPPTSPLQSTLWALIPAGFIKKARENVNIKLNKLLVKFLFIILFF